MGGTSTGSLYRRALIVLFLSLLAAMPAAGCVLIDGEPPSGDGFLTFDQLPAASPLEERIAAYEEALESLAASGEEGRQDRPSLPGFIDVAVDFSSLTDPEDALAAAHLLRRRANAAQPLAPTAPTLELYERLGVALLSAARQARLDQELERAHNHLRAARHVFALADKEAAAGNAMSHDHDRMSFLYRAIVGLEEILVTGSQDTWPETAALLARQLVRKPVGPRADWARRMLHEPATYVGEKDVCFDCSHHVGGDVRKPVKIFAPPPRFTLAARVARIQGVIIFQVVIDRHGNVAGLKLLKGLPTGLSDEALRTMATWLFEPATLYGEPVSVFYTLTVMFRL